MTNDVVINNIINELCQKFNVAATELVPRMQAYGLAMGKLGMIIPGVFMAIFLIIYAVAMYVLHKKDKAGIYVSSDDYFTGTIAFLIAETFPTIICIVNAVQYVGWKYAPEIKAMEYVVNMFKK